MSSKRGTAVVTGVFFLVAAVAAVIALALYQPVLSNPGYVLGAGADTGVLLGGVLRDRPRRLRRRHRGDVVSGPTAGEPRRRAGLHLRSRDGGRRHRRGHRERPVGRDVAPG